MTTRILISQHRRKVNPAIAFLYSFFFTGLGEIYTGSLMQGAAFMLFRTLALISAPFYSMIEMKSSYINEIAASLVLAAAVTLICPVNSLLRGFTKSVRPVKTYNRTGFYILYSLITSLFTAASVLIFLSFFSITKVRTSTTPIFDEGDTIVIKKVIRGEFRRGESIITGIENKNRILRVIAVPGEKVSYRKNRFSVDNSELPISIFTEDELQNMHLTSYDVLCEQNNKFKYPIIQSRKSKRFTKVLKKDVYFAAPDNREPGTFFISVTRNKILGRVEGRLTGQYFFPGFPFIEADKN